MKEIKLLENDIRKYYKLSVFINKYISIITTFMLSIIIMLLSSTHSVRVLSYNTDINIISKNNYDLSDRNERIFNKKSKYIKTELLLTRSEVKNGKVKLGYGVFEGTKELFYPSNIIISSGDYEKYILSSKDLIKGYIGLLSNSSLAHYKLNVPRLKVVTDNEAISSYNLSCIDTITNNTLFCNFNKEKLINDLINKPGFDINNKFYLKIFANMSYDDEKKCNIAKTIYFKKFNYFNLKDVILKYCSDIDIDKIEQANILIKMLSSETNLFKLNKKYDYISVYFTQLVNQIYYIVNSNELAPERVNVFINLVSKGLKKDYFDKKMAILTIYILNGKIKNILQASGKLSSTILTDINRLLNGDNAVGMKGLLGIVGNDSVNIYDIGVIGDNKKTYTSNREILKNIIAENYKNQFELTDTVKSIKKFKVLNVKGNVNLIYKKGNRNIIKSIPVSFYVRNLDISTFDIKLLKINSKEISSYLGKYKKNFNSFDELYEYLTKKLYAPLVEGDWSKNGTEKVAVCEKVKTKIKGLNCKNAKIYLSAKDLGYNGDIDIILYLNKDLVVTKIGGYGGVLELDNLIKDKIKVNKTFINYLNNKLSKLEDKRAVLVIKLVKGTIKKYVDINISKLVGLKQGYIDKLETKFKTRIGANSFIIRKYKGDNYKVYFKVKSNLLGAIYDIKSNTISNIKLLDDKDINKQYSCSGLELKLSNVNSEILNGFKLNPILFMKKTCPDTISKYLKEVKKQK